jgi:basic membrane protein A and related proteins
MRRVSGHARLAAVLSLIALLLAACGGTTGGTTPTAGPTKAPITVGLVTDVGGLNDGGFNQFSHLGYENARKLYNFPDLVLQSSVISDTEYKNKLTAAANQADMVIGVGFLMEPAMTIVAKQFPNKRFAIIDGCATDAQGNCLSPADAPNVAPLFFKEQQAGCLVGAIAGQMEVDGKSVAPKLLGKNTISAVGGLPIPPVNRYIAGYKYCAKMVDPSVNVVLGYSNNFTDPTKCSAIADKQFSINSADILFQVAGGCGIGVLDSATHHNVYSIGVDVDQSKDSTGAIRPSVITSAIKRVDTAAFTVIQLAEQQGTASTGKYTSFVQNPFKFDLTNDGVGYATPSSDVPQDAIAKAMSFEAEIKAGTLTPPENIPT